MPEPVVHTDSLAAAPRTAALRKVQTNPAETITAVTERPITSTKTTTADTLAARMSAESAIDWSTALPYTVYGPAESLDTGLVFGHVVYGETEAKEVFGTLSTTAQTATPPRAEVPSLTENTAFQGFVLLLGAIFVLLLSHNLADVRQLLTRISHDAATGQHLSDGPGGSGFARFLNITTIIGILFVGVMAVKYADQFVTLSLFRQLPYAAVLGLSLFAALACATIIFYQWLVLRLAGAVTLSRSMISQLFFLKRTFFSLAVIITSPILLLYVLCPKGTGEAWFFVVVIQLAITVILYLRESLNLFISKKISILHWFLYLCTVEIFPLSLLWLLAVR